MQNLNERGKSSYIFIIHLPEDTGIFLTNTENGLKKKVKMTDIEVRVQLGNISGMHRDAKNYKNLGELRRSVKKAWEEKMADLDYSRHLVTRMSMKMSEVINTIVINT